MYAYYLSSCSHMVTLTAPNTAHMCSRPGTRKQLLIDESSWSFGKGKAQLLAAQGMGTPEVLAAATRPPPQAPTSPASLGKRGFSTLPTLLGPGSALLAHVPQSAGTKGGRMALVAMCGISAFVGATSSRLLPTSSKE
jgi:hypothetical protein